MKHFFIIAIVFVYKRSKVLYSESDFFGCLTDIAIFFLILGFTALHKAVFVNSVQIVNFLVSLGANVNVQVNTKVSCGRIHQILFDFLPISINDIHYYLVKLEQGCNKISCRQFIPVHVIGDNLQGYSSMVLNVF